MSDSEKKSWFARHKVLTVVAVLFVLAVIGIAKDSGSPSATVASKTTSSSTPTPAVKDVYALNEPAAINDQTLTVTGIKRNYSVGDGYTYPDNGKEYVVVTVQIVNNGSNQVSFNTFDFQIQDSSGVLKNEAFIPGVENPLNSGDLAAGGKVTGTLAYEVPKGDAGLKLIFKPGFWDNRSVTVKL